MNNLYTKTAMELIEDISKGKISSLDIVESLLDRIDKEDSSINAFVHLDRDKIIKDSKNLNGSTSKLKGIPVAIKDNICVEDELTTCCSKILEGFRPPYNATVIEKLKEAGAVCFGKTNMDEFAFGSSCETSCYGPTYNPWDTDRVPGGSSGGSAAAVANNEAVMALGSDTGGSIRQPAALCGVVGLKPTYGRVSRYGLIAFASSLDQIGPITRTVEDNALLLQVIAGHDKKDSTSADIEVPDYSSFFKKDLNGIKIGLPDEYFAEGLNPEVREKVEESKKILESLGASFHEVSLPHTEYAVSVYYIIATAEASSNLARFDGVQYGIRRQKTENRRQKTEDRIASGAKSHELKTPLIDMYEKTRGEGFGEEAKRRILLGTYALSSGYYEAYYLKAQKVRTLIKRDFDDVFKECDFIMTPTTPAPAFKKGEKINDPLAMYLSDIYTISANLAGIPAISLPCGFTKDKLPVGLQIMSKPFNEGGLFNVGYAFQQVTDFHKEKS